MLTDRETLLFDAAWNLCVAVNGGGLLPHKTVAERTDEARAVLMPLLDERNAVEGSRTAGPEEAAVAANINPKVRDDACWCGQDGAVIRHGDLRKAAAFLSALPEAPARAGEVCETCDGRGEIGGHVGQTAETFEWRTETCPDCAPAPPGSGRGMATGPGRADRRDDLRGLRTKKDR